MRVKSKVVEAEIVELPVGGTLSIENGRGLTFTKGDYLIIQNGRLAIGKPDEVREEYVLSAVKRPKARTRRAFGLAKPIVNSDDAPRNDAA
jgi:hypothetical protein